VSSHIDCAAGRDQDRKKVRPSHSLIGLLGKSMMSAIGRWITVVFISFFMLGCSSIRARTETPDKEWTVYPGIQRDIKDTGGVFSGKNPDSVWAKGMVTTLLLLDLPFSAVFDTVVMPYDLYRIYAPKYSVENAEKGKHVNNPP
jgi:uncharacterized protein YceK